MVDHVEVFFAVGTAVLDKFLESVEHVSELAKIDHDDVRKNYTREKLEMETTGSVGT